jgi:hypothetical protein
MTTIEELRAWHEGEGPHVNNDDPILTEQLAERKASTMIQTTNFLASAIEANEAALRDGCDKYWEPEKRHVSKIKRGSGLELDYVDHATVTRMLIDIDPLWTWRPFAYTEFGAPLIDTDESGNPRALWVSMTVRGRTIPAVGTIERPGSKNYGDSLKELIGDAIRNGAMRFGVCGGLWARGKWDNPQGVAATPADPIEVELKKFSPTEKAAVKDLLKIDGPARMNEITDALKSAGYNSDAQTVRAWMKEQLA